MYKKLQPELLDCESNMLWTCRLVSGDLCWLKTTKPEDVLEYVLSGADTRLGGLAATGAAIVHLALDFGIGADVLQSGSIAVVRVDANDFSAVVCCHTLDINVALALRAALPRGIQVSLDFTASFYNENANLRCRMSGTPCHRYWHRS